MRVYNHLNEYQKVENPVVTIGIFDGVHLGHQQIIQKLIQEAENCNGEAVLLSFFPHPRVVLYPENDSLRLINTLDEKISLLEKQGLQNIIIHPFSLEFSQTEASDFVKEVLVEKIGVHKLIIGYDHHFGKGRKGSFEHLQKESLEFGFELEEIPAQDIEEINISSSKIREALLKGNVNLANRFLGYSYFMKGTVVEGDKRGRELDFPTANIYVEEKYKLIPATGVYAVRVQVSGKGFDGMLNIGHRPTFPGKDFSIEVHILDFNEDIYGETLQVELIERVRDEIRFDGPESLKKQLIDDRNSVLNILR